MSGIYEEIEIEDMKYDDSLQMYTYPCPCGDKFQITLEELYDGEDVASCPSCTLRIRVIFDEDKLPALREDDDEGGGDGGNVVLPKDVAVVKEETKEEQVSVIAEKNEDKTM